jgi:hypothetical protein
MAAPRRYITGLFGAIAVTLLVSLITNLVVDPWRITSTPLGLDTLDTHRDYASQIRTGKCGHIRSLPHIGVGIFGSSKVVNALDPQNSAWQRDDVVNFGCTGGFIYESEALCRYLLSRHDPDTILFGIDPGDLSSKIDTRPIGDFYNSPLGQPKDAINREIRYLVGISTFEDSLATIKSKLTGGTSRFSTRGLRLNTSGKPKTGQLAFLEQLLIGGGSLGVSSFEDGIEGTQMNAEKISLLGNLMIDCRKRGIRFVTFIHPQHALLYAERKYIDHPIVPFEHERRNILQLAEAANALELDAPEVEVWDFADYHPINCEPLPPHNETLMTNWSDFNHYYLEIGDLILARLMGWPVEREDAANFGTRLTTRNIETTFERTRKGFHDYLTGSGAHDLKWKEDALKRHKSE